MSGWVETIDQAESTSNETLTSFTGCRKNRTCLLGSIGTGIVDQ